MNTERRSFGAARRAPAVVWSAKPTPTSGALPKNLALAHTAARLPPPHASHRVPLRAVQVLRRNAGLRVLLPAPRRPLRRKSLRTALRLPRPLRREIVRTARNAPPGPRDHDYESSPPLLYSETVFTETT